MYRLSSFQVFSVLSTSFLPLLFWIFPRYAAYYGGADGQWALLGTFLIALFSALVHGLLNHRFPDYTGVEQLMSAFGKWLGRFVGVLFIPGHIIFIAASLFSFSITIQGLLPTTPRLATIIALTLVAVSGAIYGLETLGRVASIVFPITTLIVGLSFLLVSFHGTWTGVFFHPVSIQRTASVAAMLLPMYFGLNVYLMLSPFYEHRNRNAVWLPILSVGFSSFIILAIYITSLRVIGYEGLRALARPIDFVLQLVQLHGLFIQRLGAFLIFIATMFETVFLANQLWAISALSRRLFQLEISREKWFVLGYAGVIVVLFHWIPNQQVADWIVQALLVPLSWAYLIVEPTVKLLVSLLRGTKPVSNTGGKDAA